MTDQELKKKIKKVYNKSLKWENTLDEFWHFLDENVPKDQAERLYKSDKNVNKMIKHITS